MKYKGCPRYKRKMPLEVEGQCEKCRKNKYKYLKTLPSVKRDRVQNVYNNPQWARVRLEAIKRMDYVKFAKHKEGLEQEMKCIILLKLLMETMILIMIQII